MLTTEEAMALPAHLRKELINARVRVAIGRGRARAMTTRTENTNILYDEAHFAYLTARQELSDLEDRIRAIEEPEKD